MVGLKLDRVEGRVFISPLSVPAEAPILPLANWEECRVPWISARCEGTQVTADVQERELVDAAGEFAIDPHPEVRWGGS